MLTLPFTVAVFMVRSFTAEQGAAAAAPGGDAAGYEAHVGRLTGMLVSSSCLCVGCLWLTLPPAHFLNPIGDGRGIPLRYATLNPKTVP